MPAIQALIDEYRAQAAIHSAIDYGQKASIRAGNRAAARMRSIAQKLTTLGNQAVAAFGRLLESHEPGVAIWAAHHLLEHMAPKPSLAESALNLIQRRAWGAGPDALGERVWLSEWKANHP